MLGASKIMAENYPRSGIKQPNFDQEVASSGGSTGDDDTTLAGLKEIVTRQQREIETHQQQLVAKEQRLKFLKQPQMSQNSIQLIRENVLAQEQKLERLKELKGKVDQQRSLNVSELDSVKALFKEKEKELAEAVSKVDTLSKQLDAVKRNSNVKKDAVHITTDEIEKLKQELKVTRESNEQKNHELAVQLDVLNQRNKQVDYLDKRIEELQARLKKKKQAEQNSVILPPKLPNPNVATVEPSIRIEPLPSTSSDISKVPLVPNPNDPRYHTLPNNFKYNQQPGIYTSKPMERVEEKSVPYSGKDGLPIVSTAQPKYPNPPAYSKPQAPRLMYKPSSQAQSWPKGAYPGDANNNSRQRHSPDVTKKDQPDSSYRPNTTSTAVNAPYKPMYASRSVIADTYTKRMGPKPMKYSAMAPHSIPAFHLQNSIISDKVSSKNNTLRSLRRRHSYTETEESNLDAALGPREVTPGSSIPNENRESPKLEPALNSSNSSHNSSTASDEPKIPNSGIVARRILRKDTGVKRNLSRHVTFDPHALLLDASLEGEFDLVQRSAHQVPDPSLPNDEGITALHNAICAGHFDIVQFLVKLGVDVNSQDIDGWTPLHCASSCNNREMVQFLVEHGACIYAQTVSDHETPAEKCEEDDEEGCAEYLYGVQEKLGVLNAGTVYALYDYQAAQPDELSFRNGDKLTVLRTVKTEREWWWARHGDREGYIPRTFLGLFPRVKVKT